MELHNEKKCSLERNLGRVRSAEHRYTYTETDTQSHLAKTLLLWDESTEYWLPPKDTVQFQI